MIVCPLSAQEPLLDIFPRKPVSKERLGVNAFVNDQRFGRIRDQFLEVRDVLGLKYVRVLFAWTDQVQGSRTAKPFFGFYDEIVRSLPRGVEAVAVLSGMPTWMQDSSNWIGSDPRKTFVRLWVRKIARRYKKSRRLKGIQIWNEPNMPGWENDILQVRESPGNYLSLIRQGRAAVRRAAPRKRVIAGATTAINQNYPKTLNYNRSLQAGGMEDLVDVWAVHYYGSHYENLFWPDGVADFLNGLRSKLWLTEIGERGINKQRAYFETTIPLLREMVPAIERIYIYQFTEDSPAEETYGLKNLTPGFTVSDFYLYLRDH